jgi:hypothetical protein
MEQLGLSARTVIAIKVAGKYVVVMSGVCFWNKFENI